MINTSALALKQAAGWPLIVLRVVGCDTSVVLVLATVNVVATMVVLIVVEAVVGLFNVEPLVVDAPVPPVATASTCAACAVVGAAEGVVAASANAATALSTALAIACTAASRDALDPCAPFKAPTNVAGVPVESSATVLSLAAVSALLLLLLLLLLPAVPLLPVTNTLKGTADGCASATSICVW